MENWKDIKGFEGLYQVSSEGRVRSIDRIVKTQKGQRYWKGRVLKPNVGTNGYYYVGLSKSGKRKSYFIHRLIAETYIPEGMIGKAEVDHINENKLDNRLENIRWLDHFTNASRSNKGVCRKSNKLEKNPRTKKVIGVKDGKVVESFDCAKKITLKYGINYSTLRKQLQNNNCKLNGINYYYEANFN